MWCILSQSKWNRRILLGSWRTSLLSPPLFPFPHLLRPLHCPPSLPLNVKWPRTFNRPKSYWQPSHNHKENQLKDKVKSRKTQWKSEEKKKHTFAIDLGFILHKLKNILSWCRKPRISSFFLILISFLLLLLFLLIHWFFWLHFPQRVQWAILSLQRQQKLCSHSTSYWIFQWLLAKTYCNYIFHFPLAFIINCHYLPFSFLPLYLNHCTLDYYETMGTLLS